MKITLLFCVIIVLLVFGLSSTCYDMILFIILLRRFIYVREIQIIKTDMIS